MGAAEIKIRELMKAKMRQNFHCPEFDCECMAGEMRALIMASKSWVVDRPPLLILVSQRGLLATLQA